MIMTRLALSAVALTSLASLGSATTYFKETFDDKWKSRWVESSSWKPKDEMGQWKHTAGKWHGDAKDKGIQVSEQEAAAHKAHDDDYAAHASITVMACSWREG